MPGDLRFFACGRVSKRKVWRMEDRGWLGLGLAFSQRARELGARSLVSK
jgi:hypothetical protein